MEAEGFLNAPEDFPGGMAGDFAEALSSLWYWEMRRALGTLSLEHLIPIYGDRRAPWFTEELRLMK